MFAKPSWSKRCERELEPQHGLIMHYQYYNHEIWFYRKDVREAYIEENQLDVYEK